MTVRVSIRPGIGGGIHQAVDQARRAEAAGFDQVWFGNDLLATSGIITLAAAATATSRIGLGVGVVEPVSLHPAQIAMIAAGMQELSGDRFLLGVGAGSAVFFGHAGIAPAPPVRRTEEAIAAVRALLAGATPAEDPAAGTGWTEQAVLHRPPAAPPPIYVGAMGPRMLAMAGRAADGALPLCLPPDRFLRARAQIQVGADAAGRALTGFDLVACVWCSIDEDADQARRHLARWIARYSGSLSMDALAEEGFDPEQFQHVQRLALDDGLDAAATAVTAAMLRLGIAGGPGEVLAHCAALLDAGCGHISFGPPLGPDPDAAMRVLGRDVLPALRAMTGATHSPGARIVDVADLPAVHRLLGELFRPAGTRLGCLATADLPDHLAAPLEQAVASAGLDPARRLARLQPRVGERAVRPDDVADFLRRYGHEYAVALFEGDRWGDADRRRIGDEGSRQGCSVLWAGATCRSERPS